MGSTVGCNFILQSISMPHKPYVDALTARQEIKARRRNKVNALQVMLSVALGAVVILIYEVGTFAFSLANVTGLIGEQIASSDSRKG